MNENELEKQIEEAMKNNNYNEVVDLYERNKFVIEKKYHSLTLKYIESLLNIGECEKALGYVNTELEMPYIPMEYEDKYVELSLRCSRELKDRNLNKIATFSDEQIIDELFVKESDLSLLILHYLEDKNIRKFLPNIREYFADINKQAPIKAFLLDLLKNQQVDETFLINTFASSASINPVTYDGYFSEEQMNYINNKLVLFKDVALNSVCNQLAVVLYMNLFPRGIRNEDLDSVVASVVYCGSKMLNNPISINEIKDFIIYDNDKFDLYVKLLEEDSEESDAN